VRVLWFVPGGVDPQANALTPALIDLMTRLSRRIELVVVPFEESRPADLRIHAGVPIVAAGSGRYPPFLRLVEALQIADELHGRRRFGVVHGLCGIRAAALAAFWGQRRGVPSIISFFGGEPVSFPDIGYGGWSRRPSRILLRFALRRARMKTAASAFLVEKFKAVGLMGPWRRLGFGIDRSRFGSSRRSSAPRPPYTLLKLADFGAIKDHATAIATLAHLNRTHPARLILAGTTQRRREIEACIQRHGLEDRVEIRGRVPPEAVPRLLDQADALIHTSRHEGQGMVLLEAAAAGCPLVSTPVGIALEMADAGAACLADVGDPVGLSRSLLAILHDPIRRRDQIRRAKDFVKAYDGEIVAQRVTAFYRELCSRGGCSSGALYVAEHAMGGGARGGVGAGAHGERSIP